MASKGPSARTPDEFVERLREVVTANVEGSAKLVTRFGDFVRNASQELRNVRPGERTDTEALLTRWLEFNLASFSAMSTQGLALFNDLLSAAESTLVASGPRAPGVRPTPTSRVELHLSGRQGERATTGFVIENNFDRSLVVTFSPTDLAPASGAPLSAALVTFEPTKLAIGPRAQGVVQASVTVTDDFVVGETYSTTIRLLGFEGKELGLSLTVLPPEAAAAKSGKSTKKRKQAKSAASSKRKQAKSAASSEKRKPATPAQKRRPRTRK